MKNSIESPIPDRSNRTKLVHEHHQGEFWKACPGTCGGYLCCGYQIITPLTGCAMYCRYCILQTYFDHEHRVLFSNFDDLEHEVRTKMATWQGVVRFGTGEFADSLHAEAQTGVAVKIAALLDPYENALVEFKTKSTAIDALTAIKRPHKVVIGFSMNTPRMIALMEEQTASLEERLRAARQCVAMGFTVAFHFDPMIEYAGWEAEYREVVDAIYHTISDPSKIAWNSYGGFRSTPALKAHLRETQAHLPLFSGEMITAADGKLRYFRPIRVAFYRAMFNAFRSHDPAATVYLCMESPEVWDECGMRTLIPAGLRAYLDTRAEEILAIRP